MEIIKDLRPCNRKYKFIHYGCCEFIANGDEFKWTTVQYNERAASVVCPQCGQQFYATPEEITSKPNSTFDGWPNVTNCKRNCKICQAKCLYRKEPYGSFVSIKD